MLTNYARDASDQLLPLYMTDSAPQSSPTSSYGNCNYVQVTGKDHGRVEQEGKVEGSRR